MAITDRETLFEDWGRLLDVVNGTTTQTSRVVKAPMLPGLGLLLVLNLTAFTTAASLTIGLNIINPYDGTVMADIATYAVAGAAVTSVGTRSMMIHTTAMTNAAVDDKIVTPLPLYWQAKVTHGNANVHTYTLDGMYVL